MAIKQTKQVANQSQAAVKVGHAIAKGTVITGKTTVKVTTSFWSGLKQGWADGMKS